MNVDAQASFENILISVIGEISNKQEPSRKFVQTFVLAEQPNGYYVLNDVFRYLADEEEVADEAAVSNNIAEEPELQAPAQTAVETTPEAEDSKVDNEVAAAKVDEKLEGVEESEVEEPAAEPTQTNGTEKNEPGAEAAEEPAATAEAESLKPEQPATPESTPAPPAQKEAQAPAKEPAAPARALPKTWANIASKVGATAPVVPAIPAAPAKAPATTSTTAQSAAPAPAAAATAPTTAPAPGPESVPSQPSSTDGSGWQTAGHDHKKSQARTGDNQAVLGYIKNVTEKVNADLLRETLERFGKLTHFDVSRQKVFKCHYLTMKR